MSMLRLGVVQMQSKADARDENVAKAAGYIDVVAAQGAELVVLPEFFNHEYVFQFRDYGYMDCAEREDGHTISVMRQKAREHRITICATIFEEEGPGVYFDTAFMIGADGEIFGKYRKTHPAAVQSLEKIYFRGGSSFPVWEVKGFRVGVIICYDHVFPETARCAAVNGAELILGPFAAPMFPTWESLHRTRAFENGAYTAPTNKVGLEGEWVFGGRSLVVDPLGEVVAELSSDEDDTVVVELDREKVYAARRRWPMLRDRRPEVYGPLASADEVARALLR
ncbi:MAG: carbon-nitrogen hydrolase family protein [Thermoleophilia bacterium]